MNSVVVFALIAVFLVVPVMLGARIVNAKNTGFGSALIAVLAYAIVSAAIEGIVGDETLVFVLTAGTGAIVLSSVLGTTIIRGLAVSVFASIVQVVVVLIFAGAVAG